MDVTTLIDQFSFTELVVPAASPLAQNSCPSEQRSVGYYLYYEVSTVSVRCKLVKERTFLEDHRGATLQVLFPVRCCSGTASR